MNSSILVILDSFFAPILNLFALIIAQKNKFFGNSISSEQILIIKIMGAGNFVAAKKNKNVG